VIWRPAFRSQAPDAKHEEFMATASPPASSSSRQETVQLNPFAGLLSYLIPGLGQIVQGRVAKGLLFLVCIYTLFFYGMYLGAGSVTIGSRTYRLTGNVYLPDTADDNAANKPPDNWPKLATNLYNRPQFAGQFWVGVVAWPAIWQYMNYDKPVNQELNREIDALYRDADSALVEKDEEKYKQKLDEAHEKERDPRRRHPWFGDFEREPSASSINAVHTAGDKRLELGWVFTVIAGVLNIMVIYDAVAGPAFLPAGKDEKGE
jgi:hypothetical protein